MPSNIGIGTPFSGRISYDPTLVSQSLPTTNILGTVGNYYFSTVEGFSFLMQIGGHVVTNAEI
jgi:hypothetical protein